MKLVACAVVSSTSTLSKKNLQQLNLCTLMFLFPDINLAVTSESE